jgi:membrane fusion protein (multidrug efflux system)
MKTIKYTIAGILAGILVSCGGDPGTALEKLKKQRMTLDEKIETLENGLKVEGDSLDPSKFNLVGFTEIRPGKFDHYIKVLGNLDGDHNIAVFADVAGTIKARYADVGQKVSKGQILAQIDDGQYRLQLENLQTQFKFASDLFEKQKRLWDQKIGSEVQYLQSKTTMESLEQQISVLEEQIEKFRIKSPVSGTVEECNIRPGSVVSPDPNSSAFRVVAFRQLKVSAEVSETYAAKVKAGDKAVIEFPDLEQQIDTRVDFVSGYIDPVNRTFRIECRIAEGLPGMKANMIAIVRINDYHADNSIQIPMNIILTDMSGNYVYVVRNKDNYHGAFKQPVVIGNTYNGVAEILEGLESSDRVITTGYQELIDGEYVRFELPSEAYLVK